METEDEHVSTELAVFISGDHERYCAKPNDKRLRETGEYSVTRRILWTCAVFYAHACLALMIGCIGPAFLDLLHILDASVEQGSLIFTCQGIGGMVGGLVSAWFYTKYRKEVVFTATVFLCAALNILIPFCSMLPLMCVVVALRGAVMYLNVSGCALICIESWREHEGSPVMQALHCAYSAGGVIAPFIMDNFLLERAAADPTGKDERFNVTNADFNETTNATIAILDETSAISPISDEETRVYLGFLIIGLLSFCNFVFSLGLMFTTSLKCNTTNTYAKSKYRENLKTEFAIDETEHVCMEMKDQTNSLSTHRKDKDQERVNEVVRYIPDTRTQLNLKVKILFLSLIVIYFMTIVVMETLAQNYLATFVVKYLLWSKSKASQITSAFWASFACGRFLGIFLAKALSPWRIIAIDVLLISVSTCAMIFLVNVHYLVIWICTCANGLFVAGLYAAGCSYVDEEILSITGKIYSIFLVAETSGSMVYPLILGTLIDKFSPLWFLYLAGIICLLCDANFVLLTFIVGKWGKRQRGEGLQSEKEK